MPDSVVVGTHDLKCMTANYNTFHFSNKNFGKWKTTYVEQKNESNSAVFASIFSEYNYGQLFECGGRSVRKVSRLQNDFSEIIELERV